MTLLRQIQEAAVDSKVNLPDLLRRCKLLGARLGSVEFKTWVDHELNGYPDEDKLPEYRVFEVDSFGHFVGPLGSQIKNAPIPPMSIPEKFREIIAIHKITQPISALTELLRGQGQENFMAHWPADLTALVGGSIYRHNQCLTAWKSIPRGHVAAIVDTIRTRILNFVIEIEANAPDAGEAPVNMPPIPKGEVAQVFNTYVWGGVGNLAAGSQDFTQASQMAVQKGDFGSLRDFLTKLEVPSDEIATLETSIKDDAKSAGEGKLGPKASGWLGRMVQKAGEGTLKIGASVAGTVLTKALTKYFGLE